MEHDIFRVLTFLVGRFCLYMHINVDCNHYTLSICNKQFEFFFCSLIDWSDYV